MTSKVRFGQHIEYWLKNFPHLLLHCYHVFSTFSHHHELKEFYRKNEKFKRPKNFKQEEAEEESTSPIFNDSIKNERCISLFFNDYTLFSETKHLLITKESLTSPTFVLENGDNLFFKYVFKDRVVGVKKVPRRKFYLKEVENLISAQHENVIKLFGYVGQACDCWLVLELAVCNLEEYIVEKINYPIDHNTAESFVKKVKELKMKLSDKIILNEVTKGVKHLHFKKIKHRDMKPENILIIDGEPGKMPRAVLADFGHSKKQTDNFVTAVSGRNFGSDVSSYLIL